MASALTTSAACTSTRRGLTLLELLMVMTIIGLVFGLGVRAFSGLDLGRGADADLLRGALRAARASAISERHGAAVEIASDPASGRESLRLRRMRTLGTWHFERPDGRGTDDLTAAPLAGVRQIDDGHLGRALGFLGAGREGRVEIALESVPTYDLREGFAIEVMVRLEEPTGGTICRLGTRPNVAGLECTDGGGLRGWVAPSYTDSIGREVVGGRVDIDLPRGTLLEDRWTRLALAYDRTSLRLLVDDFLAGVAPAEGPLAPLVDGLVLGGAPLPFKGSLDTLVVRGVELGEPLPFSTTLVWSDDAPRRFAFDADGGLDAFVHGGRPLEVVLATEPEEPVRISRLGVIE